MLRFLTHPKWKAGDQCHISPTLGPLMVIYKKSYVMLHLEAEWPSKQNILIADTVLAEPCINLFYWPKNACINLADV